MDRAEYIKKQVLSTSSQKVAPTEDEVAADSGGGAAGAAAAKPKPKTK
jgi:hypothetical protein